MSKLKEIWKKSKLRFYIKNTIWNYKFWLFCKKKYETIEYAKVDFRKIERENIKKRKFKGYLYEGKMYLDNPGLQIKDKEVWNAWKKKGLI